MLFLFKVMTAVILALPGVALAADRLYACGDDEVREYEITAGTAHESWRWRAGAALDLPEAYRTTLLGHIDDCKPVDNGRAILVTASTGGVVLIDRATGKAGFRANAPMAHSADILPGGRIAVALSVDPAGDRFELYDRRRSETPLFHIAAPSAHGAVWDRHRRRFFALSRDLIQAFDLRGTRAAPTLVETKRWTLPGKHDGHDLSRKPDGRYFVTTADGVWTFDPDAGSFTAFGALNPAPSVKAISAANAVMAWVQAEESWWAHGFSVANPDGSDPQRIPIAEMHLYKVRWVR